MLTVTILGREYFNDDIGEFVYPESIDLHFEHSLVSLSKWEAEFEKPFLGLKKPTDEEALGYLRAMLLDENVSPDVLHHLTEENVVAINEYMNQKMTATWFSEIPGRTRNQEIITNELIYYWMSEFNIDIECKHWHLQRLFTLIQVHSRKRQPPKKMTPQERQSHAAKMRALNEKRKAERGSTG